MILKKKLDDYPHKGTWIFVYIKRLITMNLQTWINRSPVKKVVTF